MNYRYLTTKTLYNYRATSRCQSMPQSEYRHRYQSYGWSRYDSMSRGAGRRWCMFWSCSRTLSLSYIGTLSCSWSDSKSSNLYFYKKNRKREMSYTYLTTQPLYKSRSRFWSCSRSDSKSSNLYLYKQNRKREMSYTYLTTKTLYRSMSRFWSWFWSWFRSTKT